MKPNVIFRSKQYTFSPFCLHVLLWGKQGVLPRCPDLYRDCNTYHLQELNRKILNINSRFLATYEGKDGFFFCSSFDYSWSTCLSRDGLHLNRRGNQQLGKIFVKDIRISLTVAEVSAPFCSTSLSSFPALTSIPSVLSTHLGSNLGASVSKPLFSDVVKRSLVSSVRVCNSRDFLCHVSSSKPLYSDVLKHDCFTSSVLNTNPSIPSLSDFPLLEYSLGTSVNFLDPPPKPLYSDVLKHGFFLSALISNQHVPVCFDVIWSFFQLSLSFCPHYISVFVNSIWNLNLPDYLDDSLSVAAIVEKLRQESYDPILIYKPQGKPTLYGPKGLDTLSFALGLQTKEQKEMMIKDEFGSGYPVAHFISNQLDQDTMYNLFLSIKCVIPELNINCLMTDDDKTTHPAFEKPFGP
ncbi:uncharacterized protein LOC118205054, partial [Stegodyphus dumicola]|uniref:uncharacterized protein LOC118205054 n=1 Tax=Stegodyphus dumicola TaxID=202533 RepID=UPI0015AF6C52